MKKVAIIGCGHIAEVHARSLTQLSQIKLVAFADCRLERASAFSGQYTDGNALIFEDYVQMLETVCPDVVHICTPHYLHVPMAIRSLKAGASVFMEKPPAISAAEFEQLTACAESANGSIGFCFQNRYNETTKTLDHLVQGKSLGEVLGGRGVVTWRRDADYYSDDWHGKLAYEGGGVLINQSIHTLDLLLRYLGEPSAVHASMQNHHLQSITEVEDTLEAYLEFPGQKRACFYASTAYCADAPIILELQFEHGTATLIDDIITVKQSGKPAKHLLCDSAPGMGKTYWGSSHLKCIQDFYEKLDSGGAYQNDLSGVTNILQTTTEIYRKARQASSAK